MFHGWKIVFLTFLIATFGWGLGFYGPTVYLAALVERHGWAIADISFVITFYYLVGVALVAVIGDAMDRFGPRAVVAVAIAAMGVGVVSILAMREAWQLLFSFLLMALGWAGMSGAAVNSILAPWFAAKRGLAVSLALNGASTGGIVMAPVLIVLIQWRGLDAALAIAVAAMAIVLYPLVMLWLHRGPEHLGQGPDGAIARPAAAGAQAMPQAVLSRVEIMRRRQFWTVTIPFALGLAAQVGFIIHLVAYLQPILGPGLTGLCVSASSIAAMAGRIGLGTVIDRLQPRPVAAGSIAMQIGALLVLAATRDPAAVFAASVVFGLGVGNLITFPSLIVQREFAGRDFSRVVAFVTAINQLTYAFGPALVGWLREQAGSYALPHLVCAGLMAVSAAVVLIGPRRGAVTAS